MSAFQPIAERMRVKKSSSTEPQCAGEERALQTVVLEIASHCCRPLDGTNIAA